VKQNNSITPKWLFLAAFLFFLVLLGYLLLGTGGKSERLNILILGKSGTGYSAPDLTDTLIFASVSLEKPKVVLISIPRDIWIPKIRAKINSAYYWGGSALAKSTVAGILGQPVHYVAVLDFSSFREIIDSLGGIEVKVERSFSDAKYPLAGREKDLCEGDKEYKCRYETLRFTQGKQFMDGETALKFVRSRNGDNGENTDLAREARQQKVITAIKEKIFSWQTFLNPKKDLTLLRVLKSSLETDIDWSSGLLLAKRLILSQGKISSFVFPEDFLTSPPKSQKYDNQYVFIPKKGDWSEVWEWTRKNFL
jgi:LCP family protein required for cell wall assembly